MTYTEWYDGLVKVSKKRIDLADILSKVKKLVSLRTSNKKGNYDKYYVLVDELKNDIGKYLEFLKTRVKAIAAKHSDKYKIDLNSFTSEKDLNNILDITDPKKLYEDFTKINKAKPIDFSDVISSAKKMVDFEKTGEKIAKKGKPKPEMSIADNTGFAKKAKGDIVKYLQYVVKVAEAITNNNVTFDCSELAKMFENESMSKIFNLA